MQKVGRVNIYRATDAADALSVRTMRLVKTIDLTLTNQTGNLSLILSDDFEDGSVPYGDMLFYRIVALRKVSNPNGGIDWAPSQPSKLLLTTVPDTINPQAPDHVHIQRACRKPCGAVWRVLTWTRRSITELIIWIKWVPLVTGQDCISRQMTLSR